MNQIVADTWGCNSCGRCYCATIDVCPDCSRGINDKSVDDVTSVIQAESVSIAAYANHLAKAPLDPAQSSVSSKPQRYFLSVDIERSGPQLDKNCMLMIGICFGTADGKIILTYPFCWMIESVEFDPITMAEFWSKHPAILEDIKREGKYSPMADFIECLKELEHNYGPFGREFEKEVVLRFISDEGGYDFGHISIEMFKHGVKRHLQEFFSDFVPSVNPTERLKTLSATDKATVMAQVTAPHDHWAVNDATRNYQMMVAIDKLPKK